MLGRFQHFSRKTSIKQIAGFGRRGQRWSVCVCVCVLKWHSCERSGLVKSSSLTWKLTLVWVLASWSTAAPAHSLSIYLLHFGAPLWSAPPLPSPLSSITPPTTYSSVYALFLTPPATKNSPDKKRYHIWSVRKTYKSWNCNINSFRHVEVCACIFLCDCLIYNQLSPMCFCSPNSFILLPWNIAIIKIIWGVQRLWPDIERYKENCWI